jgi:hypothetical protein
MAGGSYNLYFLAPTTGQTVFNTRYNSYTAVKGIITVSPPAQQDIIDLMQMGCIPVTTDGGGRLLGQAISAPLNSVTDIVFAMTPWAQQKCRVTKITVTNASANLSGASIAGEIWTGPAGTGTAIVTTITTPMAALTTALIAEDLALSATPAAAINPAGLQLRLLLSSADANPDTADFYVFGDIYL